MMKQIVVNGKPGDYFPGGRVQWDGDVVGSVLEVKKNGDAICEIDDELYDELFEMDFVSIGCNFSDMN